MFLLLCKKDGPTLYADWFSFSVMSVLSGFSAMSLILTLPGIIFLSFLFGNFFKLPAMDFICSDVCDVFVTFGRPYFGLFLSQFLFCLSMM